MRLATLTVVVSVAALSAACTEKPQTSTARKADSKAYEAAPKSAFVAEGWKPGDANSWEEQMQRRSLGQNEYSRTPPASSK